MSVPDSNASCTYYPSHKVVKICITRQDDNLVELRHYEVSINGTRLMKTCVSAESDNPAGLFYNFYPVEKAPTMAQIVAVDVCGQQSGPTMINCTCSSEAPSSGGGSLWVIIIHFY